MKAKATAAVRAPGARAHMRLQRPSLADYLAVMSRAILQAGLSWAQIDRQWDKLLVAFDRFDPTVVARYGRGEIERLGATPSIVHSERKVNAIIHNARTICELNERFGGFAKYLGSFRDYDSLCADLKERFSYLGDISIYYFLFRVGEKVPSFARWSKTVKGEHPRIREMVRQ